MTITTKDTGLKAQLSSANPNTLPDALRNIKFGTLMRALPTRLFRKDPAASSYNLSTVESVGTAEDAPAASILRATVRAGGVTGELTPKTFGTTPQTGEIAVAPNGNVVVLASDVITDLDIEYVPEACDIVELQLPVSATADTFVIPAQYTTAPAGVLLLLEAEAIAGTVKDKYITVVPSDSKPGTTKQACLKLLKDKVLTKATDGVTLLRVKLAVSPSVDADAALTAASATI